MDGLNEQAAVTLKDNLWPLLMINNREREAWENFKWRGIVRRRCWGWAGRRGMKSRGMTRFRSEMSSLGRGTWRKESGQRRWHSRHLWIY